MYQYHPDLQELMQELVRNENGVAQDRILLYEIYRQLLNQHDANSRFHETFIKFTQPHHNALMQRFDHTQDMQVTISKHDLIATWRASQFYLNFIGYKDSPDIALKCDMLNKLHSAIEGGVFNIPLKPQEIEEVRSITSAYENDSIGIGHSEMKINLDYKIIVDFFTALK